MRKKHLRTVPLRVISAYLLPELPIQAAWSGSISSPFPISDSLGIKRLLARPSPSSYPTNLPQTNEANPRLYLLTFLELKNMSRRRNADEELVALPSEGSDEEEEYEDSEDDVPPESDESEEEEEEEDDNAEEEDDGKQDSKVNGDEASKKRKLENSNETSTSVKKTKSASGNEAESNGVVSLKESATESDETKSDVANDKNVAATATAADKEQRKEEETE